MSFPSGEELIQKIIEFCMWKTYVEQVFNQTVLALILHKYFQDNGTEKTPYECYKIVESFRVQLAKR